MKNLSRLVKKARRKVYREIPVATCNRIIELDHRMAYSEMTLALDRGRLGVLSAGAALALWRACHERGLRAWCYEFGFPQTLTYTLTVVEVDNVLQVHDAFFNLSYPFGLDEMLVSLRGGVAVSARREVRDRKIYIADPAREPEHTLGWLASRAVEELEPVDGLRRFELLWGPEAFAATSQGVAAVSRDLAARGYPDELQFLMLHPVSVFDGQHRHCDPSSMPLVGGRDLRSPVAELRVATRDLETERATAAERGATISRLEAELAEAISSALRSSAGYDEAERAFVVEREAWLQQKAAMRAEKTALEGELAETRRRLSSANDLRAQTDSRIAQLRAELEDGRAQLDQQRSEHERLVALASATERETDAAREHAIEVSHSIVPLIDELNQARQSLAAERARTRDAAARAAALEARLAASPGVRLAAFWRRLARGRIRVRAGRARAYPKTGPSTGVED
ncbi:MAG: hypothetical protein J2P48_17790 [Alphaproteobacteria bacterium]|nr:hypothetical protein [Alphaproteobacteria bacterium]